MGNMGNVSAGFFVYATDLGPSWPGVFADRSADEGMEVGANLQKPCPEGLLDLVDALEPCLILLRFKYGLFGLEHLFLSRLAPGVSGAGFSLFWYGFHGVPRQFVHSREELVCDFQDFFDLCCVFECDNSSLAI